MIDIAQNKTSKPLSNCYTVRNGVTIPLSQAYSVISGKTSKGMMGLPDNVIYDSGKENIKKFGSMVFPTVSRNSYTSEYYDALSNGTGYVITREKNNDGIKLYFDSAYTGTASVYPSQAIDFSKYKKMHVLYDVTDFNVDTSLYTKVWVDFFVHKKEPIANGSNQDYTYGGNVARKTITGLATNKTIDIDISATNEMRWINFVLFFAYKEYTSLPKVQLGVKLKKMWLE